MEQRPQKHTPLPFPAFSDDAETLKQFDNLARQWLHRYGMNRRQFFSYATRLCLGAGLALLPDSQRLLAEHNIAEIAAIQQSLAIGMESLAEARAIALQARLVNDRSSIARRIRAACWEIRRNVRGSDFATCLRLAERVAQLWYDIEDWVRYAEALVSIGELYRLHIGKVEDLQKDFQRIAMNYMRGAYSVALGKGYRQYTKAAMLVALTAAGFALRLVAFHTKAPDFNTAIKLVGIMEDLVNKIGTDLARIEVVRDQVGIFNEKATCFPSEEDRWQCAAQNCIVELDDLVEGSPDCSPITPVKLSRPKVDWLVLIGENRDEIQEEASKLYASWAGYQTDHHRQFLENLQSEEDLDIPRVPQGIPPHHFGIPRFMPLFYWDWKKVQPL